MSFCSEIKDELSGIRLKPCCRSALIYGFALFGRSFNIKRICLQTENENAAELYAYLLGSVYGADVYIKQGGDKRPTFCAQVPSEADRLKVLASVDFGIYDGNINRELLSKECCFSSFVRGAFLSCGHFMDPEKGYRVDFSVKDESLAKDFKSLLFERGIAANISKRGAGYNVYIKQNEMVGNLLALMGASVRSLQLIETAIYKSFKNNSNRTSNCDTANISRTVEASFKQRKAIEYLEKRGILSSLPDNIVKAANLRKNNPELSLKQLCSVSDEPITVSGLNHRLQRIMEIYEEIKK